MDFVVKFSAAHKIFFACYCASENCHQQGWLMAVGLLSAVPERLVALKLHVKYILCVLIFTWLIGVIC